LTFVSKKKAREGIFVPTSEILELEKMELEIYRAGFCLLEEILERI
jgi:hypothetical protein